MDDVLQTLSLLPAQQATRAAAQLSALALVDLWEARVAPEPDSKQKRLEQQQDADLDGAGSDSVGDGDDDERLLDAVAALDSIGSAKVLLLDFSPEGDIAFFLKSLGLRCSGAMATAAHVAGGDASSVSGSLDGHGKNARSDVRKAGQLRLARGPGAAIAALAAGAFLPGEVVLIVGMAQPSLVTKEIFKPLLAFLSAGGTAAFVHCSPRVIGGLFPGTIRATPPNALTRACVRLNLSKSAYRSLFTGFRNLEYCFLDPLRLSFEVIDDAVRSDGGGGGGDDDNASPVVLAHTNVAVAPEPLIVRFGTPGSGTVYVIATKVLPVRKLGTAELPPLVPPGGGKSSARKIGPAECEWPPSAKADIREWLDTQGVRSNVQRTWFAAKKVGFGAAPEIARGYMAFGEFLLKMLAHHSGQHGSGKVDQEDGEPPEQ